MSRVQIKKLPKPQPVNFDFLPWAIVLLAIFLTAMLRIRLLEIPLERDEGEYAYAGQLLLEGIPPYREAFNMKFPGVYGAYAAIMAVFGQSIHGIHLGLLFLNAGTIFLMFLLGRRLFGNAAGVAAATAYALLSNSAGVMGMQAHATHFVVAAAVGATLLLLRAVDTGSPASLFLSGLLYGVAILLKQHGAFFAIFGGLYLLWDHRLRSPRLISAYLSGLAAPLALTGLALWYAGVFARFWFWTVTYAREYALILPFSYGIEVLKTMLPIVIEANLLLWLLAAAGLVMVWRQKPDRVPAVVASGLLIFSFLAVMPGYWFREHYFVLMLPAIALLAAATVNSRRRITWAMFASVLGISILWQSDFLFRLTASDASRKIAQINPFPQAVELADYIREHSPESARIAVLGSEPEIYFYAHRRSVTGYIYTYGMMEAQPFALMMQDEMIADLQKGRPEFVVFVNMETSWSPHRGSQNKIGKWWYQTGMKDYDRVDWSNPPMPYLDLYKRRGG